MTMPPLAGDAERAANRDQEQAMAHDPEPAGGPGPLTRPIDRRDFLRLTAYGGATVGLSSLLAA